MTLKSQSHIRLSDKLEMIISASTRPMITKLDIVVASFVTIAGLLGNYNLLEFMNICGEISSKNNN